LPGSPPWRDLHEILHEGSSRRRNQRCQILSQSDQGFWFCGGSNFWLSHKKEKSPLTQGLNYRSACNGRSVYAQWKIGGVLLRVYQRRYNRSWRVRMALHRKRISELRSVACHVESYSVSSHRIRWTRCPNPSQADRDSIPWRYGKLSWPGWWYWLVLKCFQSTCPKLTGFFLNLLDAAATETFSISLMPCISTR